MDFDKVGIQVLFVAMTSELHLDISTHYVMCSLPNYLSLHPPAEENRDLLARSGFFQKCSKRWLFPSMQDAVTHAKHGLPLVRRPCVCVCVHVFVFVCVCVWGGGGGCGGFPGGAVDSTVCCHSRGWWFESHQW